MSYIILAFMSFGAGADIALEYRETIDALRGKIGL